MGIAGETPVLMAIMLRAVHLIRFNFLNRNQTHFTSAFDRVYFSFSSLCKKGSIRYQVYCNATSRIGLLEI